VLLTGATGFIGRHMYQHLQPETEIVTLNRNQSPYQSPHISANLSAEVPPLNDHAFTRIIHAAGHAHRVPRSKKEKEAFFKVNLTGTQNLLKALERNSSLPKEFVLISTVAVYGLEKGEDISEEAPALAVDPYGRSKYLAEKEVLEWCKAHQVKALVLRLPLVAGNRAPGNWQAMVKGIKKRRFFTIGGGHARRSIIWVQDLAELVARPQLPQGVYNLSGKRNPSYFELARTIGNLLERRVPNMPKFVAQPMALAGSLLQAITRKKMPFSWAVYHKMTNSLTFDSTRAQQELDWQPEDPLSIVEKCL